MWWITVGLLIAGLVFMFVEMLLVPGVGVAGFLSLAAFASACWYTFEYIGYAAGWWLTVAVLAALIATVAVILRKKTWKRFELDAEVTSQVNKESDLLKKGDTGIAQTRLAPIGTGKFDATVCEVKSFDNSMISAGTPLEVVEISGNQVLVKPTNTQS